MNHTILTMIGFLCGMGFWMMNSMPMPDVEAASITAYEMGKAECPPESVCVQAAKLTDIEPISFEHLTSGEF